jgi:hypothetical protein
MNIGAVENSKMTFLRLSRSGILVAPKKMLRRRTDARHHQGHPISDGLSAPFRRFYKTAEKEKRPVVLTVKGKAAAVVQDTASYQRLLDIAARADFEEGIRQGREDVSKGRIRTAREFFSEFESEHEISR